MSDTEAVEVGPKGRVVIPIAFRRELGLEEGDRLVAFVDRGAVVLAPRGAVRRRLRDLFGGGPSMADELMAERREQARSETG